MTGRRSFLKALLATAVVDPERLLWMPGKKTISIPNPPIVPDALIITINRVPVHILNSWVDPRTILFISAPGSWGIIKNLEAPEFFPGDLGHANPKFKITVLDR